MSRRNKGTWDHQTAGRSRDCDTHQRSDTADLAKEMTWIEVRRFPGERDWVWAWG
jgi:hypothetical protein